MKKPVFLSAICAAMALFLSAPVLAQNAPGEDPLVLTKRVVTQTSPFGGARPSSPLESSNGIPSWMKAKIVRFEAKASSSQTDGILTNADVTRTATSDGFRKTCIQEIGSNMTAANAPGTGKPGVTGTNQQIVVLKGDLVNICK